MDHKDTLATEETTVTDTATDNNLEENQATTTKTYSQTEVDNMMARMKGSLQKKLLKPYEDLGDPEELRNLRQEAQKRAEEQAIKRGEFEKTLQEKMAVKDAEITKRDQVIREYKVNSPLLNAAAQHGSVNPEQVRTLLNRSVVLSDEGETQVLNTDGSVRYTDSGTPFAVEELVKEFLDANPHFKSAKPATTNSKSSFSAPDSSTKLDISKLDMSNPQHRKVYAEHRKSSGLAR
tara:strand:- start:136 stop:840 length:705 start_codon:yes stop_codon:yes gene_type:complete